MSDCLCMYLSHELVSQFLQYSSQFLLMASIGELITQFTEDAVSDQERTCQRPSCTTKIRKGDPCLYIATIVPGKAGRFVCGPCNRHYGRKLATGVRPTGGHAPDPSIDPRIIRQSVNAAQRSCLSLLSLTSPVTDLIIFQHPCNRLLSSQHLTDTEQDQMWPSLLAGTMAMHVSSNPALL